MSEQPAPRHADEAFFDPEQPLNVYVIAPPTTNGPLHIGHLSGPFVAADIVSRAARQRGERVLTVGGVDVHPNWVLTRAENEGIDVEKLIWDYRQRIDEALDLARVTCDRYLDPQLPAHHESVASLAGYFAETACELREITLHACADCGRTLHNSYLIGTCSRCGSGSNGGTCEGCGGYASTQDLIDPRCNRCGGAASPFQARVPVLVMENYRSLLVQTWLRMSFPGGSGIWWPATSPTVCPRFRLGTRPIGESRASARWRVCGWIPMSNWG